MPLRRASGPLLSRHISGQLGGFAGRSGAYHADLSDSATVDRRDLEAVALDLDGVTDGRETTEATEDEAPDRVVGLVRQLERKPLAQRIERREPIHDKCSGRLLFEGRRFAIEFVLHLADQLLDNVLEGDEASGATKL